MIDVRIAPEQLREWLTSEPDLRVLDVRTPAEFESVHIPGSYNVPLDTLREHRAEIAGHLDSPVVLVCRSGQRAGEAEQTLAATGLPHVHVLDGGITAWQAASGPVNHGQQRWDLERQVRLVAGGMVLAGVLGSVAVPHAKWLAGAVGAGLTTAALTNSCLMARVLSAMPWNRGGACDVSERPRAAACVPHARPRRLSDRVGVADATGVPRPGTGTAATIVPRLLGGGCVV